VDADGARTLADLDFQIFGAVATLHLVTFRGSVRDVLQRSGLFERLQRENRYWSTLLDAIAALGLPADSPLLTLDARERRPPRVF
jgi:hypothetical protein